MPLRKLKPGWLRSATQKVVDPNDNRNSFVMMGTTWIDKKQVGVIHNHMVQPAGDHTVKRWSKVKKKKLEIPSHGVITDFSKNMNAVDRNNRATADYSISVRTNRFYMRLFFWTVDGVLNSSHIVTICRSETKEEWKKYA